MPIEMPRGLPFSVDTWSTSSKRKRHHFLTHAHKDHCSSISNFSSYPIYSTHLTKSFILFYYPQLDESLFVEIEVGQSITLDDPDGVFCVTALDANHCPGAVMFLFEGKFGNILHTGDCRLTIECLQKLPEKYLGTGKREPKCRLDYVFLDCTFGKASLRIPSKQSAIQEVISCIWKHPDAREVYLTCDQLGQEDILVNVCQTFGSKIYVDKTMNPESYQVLEILAPQILSQDPNSRFQMLDGFPRLYERAQQKFLEAESKMKPKPLIIRPSVQWYACEETELTLEEKRRIQRTNEAVKDQFGVWHVCYSMHSSKQELEWALKLLTPKWVVSTTPNCRAMELDFVKKHCLSNPLASDDPIWKLLDIRLDTTSKENVIEQVVGRSIPITEEINLGACDSESQLLEEVSSRKRVLLGAPHRDSNPPVTLFGRARLGFDLHSYYREKKLKAVKDNDCQQLATRLDVEEKLIIEVEHQKSSVSEIKDDGPTREDLKEKLIVTLDKFGSSEVEHQKSSVSEIQDDGPTSPDPVAKPVNFIEGKVEAKTTEEQLDKSFVRDPEVCEVIPYIPVGSSKGYSANLRKLYRSMNVPVPAPLPSLVELMKKGRNAKRKW